MTREQQLEQEEKLKAEERRKKAVAENVRKDFENRQEMRRSLESSWLLNMNFFSGNQYCDVSPFGGVVEEEKQFYWQSKRVYNHIAPMVDSRLAKLEKLRPHLSVRAFSDEDGDLKASKLATGILKYATERIYLKDTSTKVNTWAEVCGSAFYKVLWNEKGGRQVAVLESGEKMYEGEVSVTAVSPFEIYPDRLDVEDLENVHSLIHAKVVSIEDIYQRFGVALDSSESSDKVITSYSRPSSGQALLPLTGFNTTTQQDGVLLIERYTMPTKEYPDGRLEIVAGKTLLFEGVLPYKNRERGERGLPFVKQDCLKLPGAFFGSSIVDRLIPVQRAYNAVRNRKHEFMNRLSLGVLTVEDGSIDTDDLAEEGLIPGKVIVYRQGGKAPEMLDCGDIPNEFSKEEEWLEKEFSLISGVSDLSQNSTPVRVTSATGLQLLLSQDETRLSVTLGSVRRALKEVSRQILRLYRQFAGNARLMTLTGENKKTQIYYFNASDLAVNDIQFEAEDTTSPEEKKETILKLYEAGLLTDSDGKLTTENKNRILEAFGFGGFENAKDISSLHIAKAQEENLALKTEGVAIDVYDDHELHISEHIRFLLSAEFKKCNDLGKVKQRFTEHLEMHKKAIKEKEEK